MIRHIILWQLKDEMSEAQKQERRRKVKAGLEELAGQIPGMRQIHVVTERLPGSNVDMMLDCSFETIEALEGYRVHPAHVAVAEKEIRPFYQMRLCMDFDEEANGYAVRAEESEC